MRNRFIGSITDELEGYLGLGMADATLKAAKQILKSKNLRARDFSKTVEAILIQADFLKPWRSVIERAYQSLSDKDQKQAAIRMLHFYVSVEDWSKAARYIPRRISEPTNLLFTMWTWLHLGELEKAHALHKKCLRKLQATAPDNDLVMSSLLEALGSYYAQAGEWSRAEAAWETSQSYPTFAENAWDGLVKLHALRGLLQANVAFESVKHSFLPNDTDLILPGNSRERCFWIDKKFHRYANHLARVIPARERWKFGR